jgi:hypothetical protein
MVDVRGFHIVIGRRISKEAGCLWLIGNNEDGKCRGRSRGEDEAVDKFIMWAVKGLQWQR